MKLLFVTDLHGDISKYNKVLEILEKENPDVYINGGDILPKNREPIYYYQKKFLEEELSYHFKKAKELVNFIIYSMGNDDLAALDEIFINLCSNFNIMSYDTWIGNYVFYLFNKVPDYPFRLKDRCYRDSEDFVYPPQLGTALLSNEDGSYEEIKDWIEYNKDIWTLEDHYNGIKKSIKGSENKTILINHCPPFGVGLDVCCDGREVGSKSLYNFIEDVQPKLILSGHIHESPRISGIDNVKIGETLCIQPGQEYNKLTYVIIDLETMEFNIHNI